MTIYADADALPNVLKEILYRAADRLTIPLVLVANTKLPIPKSPNISNVVVPGDPDAADHWIVEHVAPGDLVITQDIPLADRVISKDAHALNPRGDWYTKENIKMRLAVRDLLEDLRNSDIQTGGPSAYRPKDRQAFANALDRFLNGRKQ